MIFRSTYRRPILIVGNGVRNAGACELLHEFRDKTKIPVLTSMNAADLMQDNDKLGFIGVYGHRTANMIVTASDLVIAVGVRLGLRQIGNKPEFFAPNAHLIRADNDQFELSRDVKQDEEKYLTDAKDFMLKLIDEEIPRYDEWNAKCFEAKRVLNDYDKQPGNYCLEKISSILPENPVVAVDIGQNQCWAAQSLTLKGRRGRMLIGGSYGSMGCGLPYAVGASFAIGRGKVYCVTGDGGLQMNIQELQTVKTERLPVKIFVINNRALGKITEVQASAYEGRFLLTTENSGYHAPDFVKISEAYGIKAMTLESYDEIEKCRAWLEDDEPCMLNILLPEDTLLLPKMNWNQKEMMPLPPDDIMNKVRGILGIS